MSCVAFYLLKGFELDYLLNLSDDAKAFFVASMEVATEFEEQRIEKMFGSILGGK